MNLMDWLSENYPSVLATLGIGGGSGLLGKKLVDREQNKKISELQKAMESNKSRIEATEKALINIQNEIHTNTEFDKQLREEFKEHRSELNRRLTALETGQGKILDYIITLSSKK